MARVLANALPAALGQNVFIENKPGAGNTIGSRQAADQRPHHEPDDRHERGL